MSETTKPKTREQVAAQITTCPRRIEQYGPGSDSRGHDKFINGQCSYCGSLSGDLFMERLEKGDVVLGSTDKNYKVYVTNDGGADFTRGYRTDSLPFEGHESTNHTWVVDAVRTTKFYFQHLSEAQRARFIELYNDGKFRFEMGISFYVPPFFCRPVPRIPS